MKRLFIRSAVCVLLTLALCTAVFAAPNDPRFAEQWTLDAIHYDYDELSSLGLDGSGVCVAILDSGLYPDAPDLAGVSISPFSRNFLGTEGDEAAAERYDRDQTGHGTLVAGRIAAQTNNSVGYASVAPGATLMILRCYAAEPNGKSELFPYMEAYDEGSGSMPRIAEAICYAVDHGADVINMSFGSIIRSSALESAIEYAVQHGVILVASSGNGSGDTVSRGVLYPAVLPGVISVGSLEQKRSELTIALSSVENSYVDISAPGQNVDGIRIYQQAGGGSKNAVPWDDLEDSFTLNNCGTSFAAPIISGMAAIAKQLCPHLSSDDFLKLLALSCTDLGEAGRDDAYGYGAADLKRLVSVIRNQRLTLVCEGKTYTYQVGEAPDLEIPEREGDAFLGWRTEDGKTIYAAVEDLPLGELTEAENIEDGAPGSVRYDLLPLKLIHVFESDLPALFPEVPEPVEPVMRFTDVTETAWYYDDVEYCWSNQLLNGIREDYFDAEGTVTRAMAVTMLWRLEGKPLVIQTGSFSDVEDGQWYTDAVRWASTDGIAFGDGNGAFRPEDAVSREELAVLLRRYAECVQGKNEVVPWVIDRFSDADQVSDWAADGVRWCVASGILGGRDDLRLDPVGTASRAEAAAMLHRFAEQLCDE